MHKLVATALGTTAALAMLTGCADRIEPPGAGVRSGTDQVKNWAEENAAAYSIPERALQAYASAAIAMNEQSCDISWPTLAALGAVLSEHGTINNTVLEEDGSASEKIMNLNVIRPRSAADTDDGRWDGNPTNDVPFGPMQLTATQWETYGPDAVDGRQPDPYNIDDASVTVARQLCEAGSLDTSAGWDAAIKEISDDPEFIKSVYAQAKEYSQRKVQL